MIIFGVGEQAEMAYYYFSSDSLYEIITFTVDKQFISEDNVFNLPVVEFETLDKSYRVNGYELFITILSIVK